MDSSSAALADATKNDPFRRYEGRFSTDDVENGGDALSEAVYLEVFALLRVSDVPNIEPLRFWEVEAGVEEEVGGREDPFDRRQGFW